MPEDPMIQILAGMTFNAPVLDKLFSSWGEPEEYTKYLNAPDIYVLMAMINNMRSFDPNKGKLGDQDHQAMVNLLKWMLVKFTTDPVWMSYIGWFGRMYGSCQHRSSYWKVSYNDRFYPGKFFTREELINAQPTPEDLNKNFTDEPPMAEKRPVEEVFKL